MADSNTWVNRHLAMRLQEPDKLVDIYDVGVRLPSHSGSSASPYLTGQFRRWLAEGAEQGSQPQERLGFAITEHSSTGEKIISGFTNNLGPVVIGLPVENI